MADCLFYYFFGKREMIYFVLPIECCIVDGNDLVCLYEKKIIQTTQIY